LHPQVREAAVSLIPTTTGDPRLVAYVVARTPSLSQDTLTSFLAHHLPDYMIPRQVVWMDHLPLSPNGKLDRHALPTPDWSGIALSTQEDAPRTPLEEVLLGIWQEVLGLPQPGIHDNFFRLGGHSLLATRVVSQLDELFHVQLPLRTIFEAPTIAEQATIMLQNPDERGRIERTAQLLVEIAQLSEDEVEALLNEQKGI
jgi:hypothetical protein